MCSGSCVSACVSRLAGARRRRGAAQRSLSSLRLGGQPQGGQIVDGQRLARQDGRAVASRARGRERAPEVYQRGPLRHLANSIFNGRRAVELRGIGRPINGSFLPELWPQDCQKSSYQPIKAANMRVLPLVTAVAAFRGPVSRVVRARASVRNNAHRLLARCLGDSGCESPPVHAPGLAGAGRGSSSAPLPKSGLPAPHLQQ